jgi:hypothetical protein
MKTVIDAVNELEGEWVDGRSYVYHSSNTNSMYRGEFDYTYQMHSGRGWDLVCTNEEFLATVAECETNFGKCILYAEYKTEYARKEKVIIMLDELHKLIDEPANELDMGIDWSKAPEGATHYAPETEYDVDCWVWVDGNEHKFVCVGGYTLGDKIAWNNDGPFNGVLIPRPVQSSIFTQEMADNGVLPSVGMECIAVYGKSEAKVTVAHINNKKQFACIDDNGDYFIHYPKEDIDESFKPLTPPITLIDGECYSYDYFGPKKGFYNKSINRLVSLQGSSNPCAVKSIQPLTVEVK